MNFKTTIVLLAVLVVAGIAVFFTRDSGTKPDTTVVDADKKLLTFTPAEIDRITIEPDNGKRLVLKRDGLMNWRLVEPVDAPAESNPPTEILTSLSSLTSTGHSAASGADAAATGLAPPRFKVELVTKDGKSIKLDVGDRTGTGGQLYVKKDGESQADLVQADVYDQLDKPLKDFRRAKLLDLNSADVQHLQLDRPEGSLVLDKKGGAWTIQQPTTMPAETSAVSDLLLGLSGLQATSYVTDPSANPRLYGFDHPTLTISYSTKLPTTEPTTAPVNGPTTIVKFGMLDLLKKNIYVTASPGGVVAQVAATSLDTFKQKPLDLRDKQVVNIDPGTVATVSIETNLPATTQPTTRPASASTVLLELRPAAPASAPASQPTTLATTAPTSKPTVPPTKWQVASNAGAADADDVKTDALLALLHPLRVQRYLEAPATQPAAVDRYTISIESPPPMMGSYKIELMDPGNGRPVVGSYNGLTFELDRTMLDKVKGDFLRSSAAPTDSGSMNGSNPTQSPGFPSVPPGP